MKLSIKLLLLCWFTAIALKAQEKLLIDNIAVSGSAAKNRIFTFTNKHFSQFHGTTDSYSDNGWHGWICREQKIFTDFQLTVHDRKLDRKKASCSITPYNISRVYPGNITEELLITDSLDAILVNYRGLKSPNFTFTGFQGGAGSSITENTLSFDLDKLLPGYKLIVVIDSNNVLQPTTTPGSFIIKNRTQQFSLLFSIQKANTPTISFSRIRENLKQRKYRINQVLEHCKIESSDKALNKAYLWACASVDKLVTTQEVKGIFAGLPWFNNNWGRDTFIALPGACLVNGFHDDAREILEAFFAFQDTIPNSAQYGRVPNRVTLQDAIYNTTDGTPYCIMQAYNYWQLTGDEAFIQRIYPKIKLAYTAAMLKFVDETGFLTHKDAETWMDAVGPDGPWSPRGNRANDIQMLWHSQLAITNTLAEKFGDSNLQKSCKATLEKLEANFPAMFVSKDNKLADRLQSDGKADFTQRPNVFITLLDSMLIKSKTARTEIFRNAFNELAAPYGVLSLSYKHTNFHPYHEYPPYYPKDAAYHNGIIWQWNAGPLVSVMCKAGMQDSALLLTRELVRQILRQGAVGTIAELMEALPRANEKEIRLSGAFSQAWSLGEFIRNIREDYLGISTNLLNKTIVVAPVRSGLLNDITFPVFYGKSVFQCKIQYSKNNYHVRFKRITGNDEGTISIRLPLTDTSFIAISGDSRTAIQATVPVPGANKKAASIYPVIKQSELYNSRITKTLSFIRFGIDSTWRIYQKPVYPLLEHSAIKQTAKKAVTIIEQQDSLQDEQYMYPTNPQFKPGILDIKSLKISGDEKNYYFTLSFAALHNPQWHPEYGFQLTIAGIYIKNNTNSAGTDAFKNTNYRFDTKRPFSKVIFIGGGIELWNSSGEILAAYTPKPEDGKNPLGNTATGTIYFSLPKALVGEITDKTPITVLAGAQDDHGGAGLGEFRMVQELQGEWLGGGKKDQNSSNVFDELRIN